MPAAAAARWVEAAKLAEGLADPVAQKLATYFRVLTPGAASAEEIASFMAQNPDWPNQALLERRREEAIGAQPDIALVVGPCLQGPITLTGTLVRCADALGDVGNLEAAIADASKAWVDGYSDPAGVPKFLRRWSAVLTPADEWDRFRHFAWSDPAAAARQISRLVRAAAPGRQGAPGSDPRGPECRRTAPRPASGRADRARPCVGRSPLVAPRPARRRCAGAVACTRLRGRNG